MRTMSRLLALLCLLFLPVSAQAEGQASYSSAFAYHCDVVAVNGRVYCIDTRSQGILDWGAVYEVNGTTFTPVYQNGYIDNLYPLGDQLAVIRAPFQLHYIGTGGAYKTYEVEVLDPLTGKSTRYDHYRTEDSKKSSTFAAGGRLFTMLADEHGTLQAYTAPFKTETVAQCAAPYAHHATFYLMEITPTRFQKDRASLVLYDYQTGQILRTQTWLTLPTAASSQALQAILRGTELYYLSADGIRIYDFATHEDRPFLSLPTAHLGKFLLTEDALWVISFEDSSHLHGYDLTTGAHITTYALTNYPENPMIYNNVLYIASYLNPGQLECLNLKTGEDLLLTIPE